LPSPRSLESKLTSAKPASHAPRRQNVPGSVRPTAPPSTPRADWHFLMRTRKRVNGHRQIALS
jgi:hypothetical protein